MPNEERTPDEAPWILGLRGARANLWPGIALQVVALAVGLAYYFVPVARHALEMLSEFRARTGFGYSIVATGIFGGLLPCLYLKFHPATRHRYRLAQNITLIVFWAYKGFEVDAWYRTQAWWFGTHVDIQTVATKTFFDQLVYCPIWAVPWTVWIYAVVESDFDFRAVWADVRAPRWYMRRALPNLISNLGVWIPAVCVIYSLPSALQIPLFNLVLCFFTLLLAHLSAHLSPNVAAKKVGDVRFS